MNAINHTDTIPNIEAIERNDLWPLLVEGDARVIHNSRRNYNPDFGVEAPSLLGIRVYQLDLKGGRFWPFTVSASIKFTYDIRKNRGHIHISADDASVLYQALTNGNGNHQSKAVTAETR